MRLRNRSILVRLTERELIHLKQQAQNAGLGMEPFIRSLIMGSNIKPYPPAAYAGLLRELSAIGNNLNQIARIANTRKGIYGYELEEALHLVAEAVQRVKAAF